MAHVSASPRTFATMVTGRFGERRGVFSRTLPHAAETGLSNGLVPHIRTCVPTGMLARAAGSTRSAGRAGHRDLGDDAACARRAARARLARGRDVGVVAFDNGPWAPVCEPTAVGRRGADLRDRPPRRRAPAAADALPPCPRPLHQRAADHADVLDRADRPGQLPTDGNVARAA